MKNKHIEYTTVKELVAELQKEIDAGKGDLPICVNGVSPIYLDSKEYYYDGGYACKSANDSSSYISSKRYNQRNGWTEIAESFPRSTYYLTSSDPASEPGNKMNGRSVREIDPESWQWLEEKENEEREIFDGQLVNYRWLKGKPSETDTVCAYLESGEEAYGKHMSGAKEKLIEVYNKKKEIEKLDYLKSLEEK